MVYVNLAGRLCVALLTAAAILLGACPVLYPAAGASAATRPGAAPVSPQAAHSYLVMENVGQYAPEVRYLLKMGDRRIWLTRDAVWLQVPDSAPRDDTGSSGRVRRSRDSQAAARSGTTIRFSFPSANSGAALEPSARMPARVSYLIGNDPALWQRDIPVWSGIRYRDLYPGIDLVIGEDAAGVVPWRFEARTGADLQAVSLRAEGAVALAVDEGRLQLALKGRAVDVALPAWSLPGQKNPLATSVVEAAGTDAFILTPKSQPQLEEVPEAAPAADASSESASYSYSFGGGAWDKGYAIAVDDVGNAYVTGETESDDFPGVAGHYDPANLGPASPTDAFVAKLDATGNTLVYATYLGGQDLDLGTGVAVNGSFAYVVGQTRSPDFPGTQAAAKADDIFVVVLNAHGTGVRYVSLLGGDQNDQGMGIALDGTKAYITGIAYSPSLPGELTCTDSPYSNLVVARLNTLEALLPPEYTTCLGGVGSDDYGLAIAVRGGVAYVTGQSWGAFPGGTTRGGGDILLASFDANGDRVRSTLLGGALEDSGNGIAVDGAANIYIAGTTKTYQYFAGIVVPWGGGSTDAVLLKMTSTFTGYFATYVGGNGEDEGSSIAVDTVQGLYVAGTTTSTNLPGTAGRAGADSDAFVARMHLGSAVANKVTHATYLGNTAGEEGYGVATDTGGYAFVTGARSVAGDPDPANVLVANALMGSPPNPPALRITASGQDAGLNWDPITGATKYQVFGSSAPHFTPGDWSSNLPLVETTGLTFPLPGALAAPGSQFYVAKTVSTAPEASANSTRVGYFTYPLSPGTN